MTGSHHPVRVDPGRISNQHKRVEDERANTDRVEKSTVRLVGIFGSYCSRLFIIPPERDAILSIYLVRQLKVSVHNRDEFFKERSLNALLVTTLVRPLQWDEHDHIYVAKDPICFTSTFCT